jgi:hypothetical protein
VTPQALPLPGGARQFLEDLEVEVDRVTEEGKETAEVAAQEAFNREKELIENCLESLGTCPVEVANRISGDDIELVNGCLADIPNCPGHIIRRLPAHALKDIIAHYKDGLIGQAHGRWQTLPQWFISEFEDDYPNVDLGQVRYATNIKTVHGQAITFYYQIFFPQRSLDLFKRSDKEWMLHELQHTQQYALKGGEDTFLSEYVLHAPGEALARRTVNVHDNISIEEDAIAKADELITEYGWTFHFKNNCHRTVRNWISYLNTSGEWMTGFSEWPPNDEGVPVGKNGPVHTTHRIFYSYSEIPGTQWTWTGDFPLVIHAPSAADPQKRERKTVKAMTHENKEDAPEWLSFSVSCSNVPAASAAAQ